MLLGFTHFFQEESQKQPKFLEFVKFQPRIANSADPESKRP